MKTYRRFFREDLMEQRTFIEIGLHTKRGLAPLTANFGLVSKLFMQKTTRHATKVF